MKAKRIRIFLSPTPEYHAQIADYASAHDLTVSAAALELTAMGLQSQGIKPTAFMMTKNGGKREGAGRPPGSENK